MLQALKNLPREARDTLFLLTVIAWVIAPQVGNLPVWCSATAAAVLVWRASIAARNHTLPSRWWLMGLLVLATGATFYTHKTLLGRDAGVTYIVVLLTLKTLEMRTRRDAFVIFFLGFFTLLSNFFFSQSLLTAVAMLVGLLGLLTGLINSHMPVGRPPLMQAAKIAGSMALVGAPIMVVLFVLFPRVAPLWGMPADTMTGRSGLSSSMQVGNVASLALDDSITMRIKFQGSLPPLRDMYFRGPVLSTFDGREWSVLRSTLPQRMRLTSDLKVAGQPISYEVTMEPNSRPWIMVLDAAIDKPALNGFRLTMASDLVWVADQPVTDLVRYTAQSYTTFRHGPAASVSGLQDYVDLPRGFNPRTLQLAADMRGDARYAKATTMDLVNAVLERLRTGGYVYTLEPGVFGTHTADEFWFDRKQGFCEHIASSFVILMRALNIPARVVTGYQGGDINSVDGFWTVRQSDAHAWAEVWVADQGWVRVDPTSAVAPGRTGSFARLQPTRNAISQALSLVSPQFNVGLRALWDAVNNRWNQWVLNYTQSRQLDMLKNLGFESPSWEDLSYVMIALIVAAASVAAAWALWERHRQDPWLRLLHLATQRLQRAGLVLPSNTSPRQVANLLKAQAKQGDASIDAIAQWLYRMEVLRYAPHPEPQQLGTLRREFRSLPWPQHIVQTAPST